MLPQNPLTEPSKPQALDDLHPSARETAHPAEMEPKARAVKRIIAAVDRNHHPAMKMALTLAEPLHAEIAVVHVLEPLASVGADNVYLYAQTVEDLREAAKALLHEIKLEVPESSLAFTSLREGNAAAEINSVAAEWDADLIVMGTRRRGAIARALMGSTSQGVLRHGHRPVLLVSDN